MSDRPHTLPLVEASALIDDTLALMEADSLVNDLAEIVNATIDNPAIPMFARVAAMMTLVSGSANGALEMLDEGVAVSSFHDPSEWPTMTDGFRPLHRFEFPAALS
jgi:hypothetical protein